MFPFKVRFSKFIKTKLNPNQIDGLLNVSGNLLSSLGANYFSREKNRLEFENKIFTFSVSWLAGWELRAPIDGGLVEIKEPKNKSTRIRYSITVTRIWVLSTIVATIIWVSEKNLVIALLAFGALGIVNCLIAIIRHWGVLYLLTDKIMDKINENNECAVTPG